MSAKSKGYTKTSLLLNNFFLIPGLGNKELALDTSQKLNHHP